MLDALRDLWAALLALPHLKLYLSIGWAVYLLWLGSWIVLQKREPAATEPAPAAAPQSCTRQAAAVARGLHTQRRGD